VKDLLTFMPFTNILKIFNILALYLCVKDILRSILLTKILKKF